MDDLETLLAWMHFLTCICQNFVWFLYLENVKPGGVFAMGHFFLKPK